MKKSSAAEKNVKKEVAKATVAFKVLVVSFSICVIIWAVFNMYDDLSGSVVRGFESDASDKVEDASVSAEILNILKEAGAGVQQVINEYVPDKAVVKSVEKPQPPQVVSLSPPPPPAVLMVQSPIAVVSQPSEPRPSVLKPVTKYTAYSKDTPPAEKFAKYASIPMKPVLGPLATNGSRPLHGRRHLGTDAVFALAAKYPKLYYQRFVGSLRKFGFKDDIVLGVSPVSEMKAGVEAYLESQSVLAYAFSVDCLGKDNCRLKDEFLGYPDPRPHRTFANIRYALYEYWMQYYGYQSYILILDFRDTFFQGNPFEPMGYPISGRVPSYDLQVYAENYKVKTIGKCVFNSGWVGECFGQKALEQIKHLPVICSGSTLGSYPAIRNYISIMLAGMDEVQCWRKGIESDQGYQSYYFHTGKFDTPEGKAVMNAQGYGRVNTIGAMNGFRVPAHMKGRLDTFWKIIDKDGFVLNYDGTRSAVVHQWDRFDSELRPFVDSGKLYDRSAR